VRRAFRRTLSPPSARSCYASCLFRPYRSSRLRRLTPLTKPQVYCTLQPTMGFTTFQDLSSARRFRRLHKVRRPVPPTKTQPRSLERDHRQTPTASSRLSTIRRCADPLSADQPESCPAVMNLGAFPIPKDDSRRPMRPRGGFPFPMVFTPFEAFPSTPAVSRHRSFPRSPKTVTSSPLPLLASHPRSPPPKKA